MPWSLSYWLIQLVTRGRLPYVSGLDVEIQGLGELFESA
jgi:hypothetical protein